MIELLVAAFALLSIADVVETYFFPRFGLREGNSRMARLISLHGFDGLFAAKYVVFAGILIAAAEGWAGPVELGVAVAMQLGIVTWNAVLMWRNR